MADGFITSYRNSLVLRIRKKWQQKTNFIHFPHLVSELAGVPGGVDGNENGSSGVIRPDPGGVWVSTLLDDGERSTTVFVVTSS